jgi:hypothetical protein
MWYMCVRNTCHNGEDGLEILQSSRMWWRSSLHIRHDIESCDQGGEDQDMIWLDGLVVSVKSKLSDNLAPASGQGRGAFGPWLGGAWGRVTWHDLGASDHQVSASRRGYHWRVACSRWDHASSIEWRGHVDGTERPDAGWQRPIIMTGASVSARVVPSEGVQQLFLCGGL